MHYSSHYCPYPLNWHHWLGYFSCATDITHVNVLSLGIRSLQSILLKICLLLGVKLYYNVEFLDVLEPDSRTGWHASVKPADHSVSKYEFDFIVGKVFVLLHSAYYHGLDF